MQKRVVCLLLIPALLLTQGASIGHSHGPEMPHGSDLAPHIHLSLLGHKIQQQVTLHHQPHDCDDNHGDQDDAPESSMPQESDRPFPENQLPDNHDGGALYLPTALDTGLTGGRPVNSILKDMSWIFWLNVLPSSGIGDMEIPGPRQHPPPFFMVVDCPIYLRTLPLLI